MFYKPTNLQFIKRGKLLCSSAFSSIVETWNWLVSFNDNVRGDADGNGGEDGHIKVDKSVSDHPVIRLVNIDKLRGNGGGGDVTLTGTDGVSVTGNNIVFQSASDSNVEIEFAKNATTGVITATIGVYYK